MHHDGVPSDPQMNTCLVRDGPQPIALVVDAAGGRISMVSALQRRGRGQHARSAAVCRAARNVCIGRPVVPATQVAAFGSP
jgi:hypothetical protein